MYMHFDLKFKAEVYRGTIDTVGAFEFLVGA